MRVNTIKMSRITGKRENKNPKAQEEALWEREFVKNKSEDIKML